MTSSSNQIQCLNCRTHITVNFGSFKFTNPNEIECGYCRTRHVLEQRSDGSYVVVSSKVGDAFTWDGPNGSVLEEIITTLNPPMRRKTPPAHRDVQCPKCSTWLKVVTSQIGVKSNIECISCKCNFFVEEVNGSYSTFVHSWSDTKAPPADIIADLSKTAGVPCPNCPERFTSKVTLNKAMTCPTCSSIIMIVEIVPNKFIARTLQAAPQPAMPKPATSKPFCYSCGSYEIASNGMCHSCGKYSSRGVPKSDDMANAHGRTEYVAYCLRTNCSNDRPHYVGFASGNPLPISVARCPKCNKSDEIQQIPVPLPSIDVYKLPIDLEARLNTAKRIGDLAAIGTLGIEALLSPGQYLHKSHVGRLVEKHVHDAIYSQFNFPQGYHLSTYHTEQYLNPHYRNNWTHHHYIELLSLCFTLGSRNSPWSYIGPQGQLMPYCSFIGGASVTLFQRQARNMAAASGDGFGGQSFSPDDFGDDES